MKKYAFFSLIFIFILLGLLSLVICENAPNQVEIEKTTTYTLTQDTSNVRVTTNINIFNPTDQSIPIKIISDYVYTNSSLTDIKCTIKKNGIMENIKAGCIEQSQIHIPTPAKFVELNNEYTLLPSNTYEFNLSFNVKPSNSLSNENLIGLQTEIAHFKNLVIKYNVIYCSENNMWAPIPNFRPYEPIENCYQSIGLDPKYLELFIIQYHKNEFKDYTFEQDIIIDSYDKLIQKHHIASNSPINSISIGIPLRYKDPSLFYDINFLSQDGETKKGVYYRNLKDLEKEIVAGNEVCGYYIDTKEKNLEIIASNSNLKRFQLDLILDNPTYEDYTKGIFFKRIDYYPMTILNEDVNVNIIFQIPDQYCFWSKSDVKGITKIYQDSHILRYNLGTDYLYTQPLTIEITYYFFVYLILILIFNIFIALGTYTYRKSWINNHERLNSLYLLVLSVEIPLLITYSQYINFLYLFVSTGQFILFSILIYINILIGKK